MRRNENRAVDPRLPTWPAVLAKAAAVACLYTLAFVVTIGRRGMSAWVPAVPTVCGILLCAALQMRRNPRDVDLAFFPRLRTFRAPRRLLRNGAARLVLLIGTALCGVYWFATTAGLEILREWKPYGDDPGPARVDFTVLAAWGFAWVADSLIRPKKATLGPALWYLASVAYMAFGVDHFGL